MRYCLLTEFLIATLSVCFPVFIWAGPVTPIVVGCTFAMTGAIIDSEPPLIMLPALKIPV